MIAERTDVDPSRPVCTLCGCAQARPLWTLELPGHPEPFRLWKCRDCGVVFNHPRLSVDAIHHQYDGPYYVFNEAPQRRWCRAAQLYIEHLLPLEKATQGRRLLEVGCANGELLALAQARGWRVQGIEISPQAAESARREHSLDVITGTLEEHAPRIGPFDVAIANDVIEHVPSPQHLLAGLRTVLRPDGWVSIETPNWGGTWRRLGGPRWLGINRFHIFLFDARCLTGLMTRCGFRDCAASSSTNLNHAAWDSRPELASILQRLPAALRWRTQRLLNRLAPKSPCARLLENPPAAIDEALARIDAAPETTFTPRCGRAGDNLTVIGRA